MTSAARRGASGSFSCSQSAADQAGTPRRAEGVQGALGVGARREAPRALQGPEGAIVLGAVHRSGVHALLYGVGRPEQAVRESDGVEIGGFSLHLSQEHRGEEAVALPPRGVQPLVLGGQGGLEARERLSGGRCLLPGRLRPRLCLLATDLVFLRGAALPGLVAAQPRQGLLGLLAQFHEAI